MTEQPATNPQGRDAFVQAEGVDAPKETDEAETKADTEAAEDDAAPPADETDEVEHDGRKYRVPRPLKAAFMMHADYTRKTQELAEQRRMLEAQRAQQTERSGEHLQAVAHLIGLDRQLAVLENTDWDGLSQKDPAQTQRLWLRYQQLKDQRGRAAADMQQKDAQRTLERQQAIARQFEEGRAALARDIKDWSPELASKVADFGVREFGFTPEEIGSVSDPRLIKVLHLAYAGDQAIKKQAASEKAAAAAALQPVPQVGANAGASARRTTDASGDRLSTDEWMRRERSRLHVRR